MSSLLLEQYSLVGIAARSIILLILTAGLAFAFRRHSAAVLHGIWTVGLGSCLAIPLVTSLSPSWSLPLLPPQETEPAVLTAPKPATSPLVAQASFSTDRASANDPSATARQSARSSTATAPTAQTSARSPAAVSSIKWPALGEVAAFVWAAGFFAVLMRLLQQTAAVQRKLQEASDLDDADWHDQRDVAARLLGVAANVSLKRHSKALSPMVVGLFRPVVILPDDADTWPNERRNQVLLHELAHVQRFDVLTQTMATVVCAVYWFNPLAWWGASQMKRLREIACDDVVVMHASVRTSYAQTLLDVARRYRCQPANAVAMARSNNVEGRIAAILGSTRSRTVLTARSVRALAAMSLVVAGLVGTCQLNSPADDSVEQAADQGIKTNESAASRTMLVRVLDDAGEPLSNANIHVSIWEMPGAKDYPNRDYTTDEQGHAEIAMPRRLEIMRMWPAKDGYVPLFVNFAKGSHREGRLIPEQYDFRLPKGHRLSGRVVDEEGNPIADAKVQVRVEVNEPAWGENPAAMISTWLTDSDFSCPIPLTDADGRWSINNAPGPPTNGEKDYEFQLQVTHPEFAGDTRWGELQQQQGISIADLRSGDAELALDRGIAVAGHVTDLAGMPVNEGLVVWNDHPYMATGVNETAIDGEGRYETKHLAPGNYPITVLAPGFAPWQQTIEVSPELSDLDIQLQPGNKIRIEFVDQSGQPVPNVNVGIGQWRGTEAIYNEKHPNVPDSGIPRRTNDDGVFEWNWAPHDAVTYRVSAKEFAPQELVLVAKPEPHVVTLAARRVVAGTVTDAATGEPVAEFLAMPVIVFRPDFYHTRTTDAKVGRDGRYELPLTGSGDPNDRYRVRFEAEGFRSVVSDESFGPLDGRATLDYSLQPAPARQGRVVDADGRPVDNALVLQASPTEVPNTSNGKPDSWDTRPLPTDANGHFQLPATTESVRIRAYHDVGFAETALAPDEEEMVVLSLQPWATISGRLMQAGHPVAGQMVNFHPLISRGLSAARFQDSYYAKTDADGNFQFDRIPPIGGTLKAYLGPWRDSPLSSSESIPLQLNPGVHREVVLGSDGAAIIGRVVATGRSNEEFSKQWSLNYLISRDHGVDYPNEATPLSFHPSGVLQSHWLRQPDFQAWVATRRNYFVKLSDDGRIAIHGVEPGEYDLAIQLYEQPAGCLVETIGEKVVPITVTAKQAATGQLDIGDVEVPCRIGPRVGSDMRAFQFTDVSGRVRHVDDMQGQYVLLHAWATWCAPCVKSMPMLKATVKRYSDLPLTVVGLNVDQDVAGAKVMAEAQQMDWAQNYVGPHSDLRRQLAVSSVPAYYLIGPDGKLVGSANLWDTIEQLLNTKL